MKNQLFSLSNALPYFVPYLNSHLALSAHSMDVI